jgi:hypothetical protein
VLEWLESTEFSSLVRSELWGWPLALTVHAFGTALVVGFIVIIGLRLLGLFELIPFSSLSRLFPVVWLGLVLQFASGFVLWAAKPTRYVADGAFVLKFGLIIAGIILTVYFQRTIKREAASWEGKGAIPSQAVKIVAATLIVWCSVVIAGRLTGYLGSIDIG